jgi:predicted amidohydrolase
VESTEAWFADLVRFVEQNGRVDLVLLPEFSFSEWLPYQDAPEETKRRAWKVKLTKQTLQSKTRRMIFEIEMQESERRSDEWIANRLPAISKLGVSVVVGTKTVLQGDQRFNEGFVWTKENGKKKAEKKRLKTCI